MGLQAFVALEDDTHCASRAVVTRFGAASSPRLVHKWCGEIERGPHNGRRRQRGNYTKHASATEIVAETWHPAMPGGTVKIRLGDEAVRDASKQVKE